MRALFDWLDHRTGYRNLMHEALFENIPGGSRWRYVWGSTLVFTFMVQMVTGVLLWMAYSPSTQTAWESVYYIQHEMWGGWLLRGVHHFCAQAMIVLLLLHLMQVVIDGAYRAPREVNFWLGLILMLIVLGLSLTGYLLPWDQKGYWATRVATSLTGLVPGIGTSLESLVIGGSDYGHHTLTRFFALHAGVLPALLIAFLVMHVAVFRRHKITAKAPLRGPDQSFWPDQILKDAVACLAVLLVVLLLVTRPWSWGSHSGEPLGDYLGAELGAPADPANVYAAARPEWYFLFLFQFLKVFEGHGETGELLGAIVIPSVILLVMFLMPVIGRWKLGHRFNLLFVVCLLIGVGVLTVQAWLDDYYASWVAAWVEEEDVVIDEAKVKQIYQDDTEAIERWRRSDDYYKALTAAEHDAERIVALARSRYRIPVEGAAWLLRNDPERLFREQCANCHSYRGGDVKAIQPETITAPNLYGFASREWVAGLLDPEKIATADYFGNTDRKNGDMVNYIRGEDWAAVPAVDKEKIVMALSAQAKLPSQAVVDARDAAKIKEGEALLKDESLCAQCHTFQDVEVGAAPILTGYGSTEWMLEFISNPSAEQFYGEGQPMPAFCPKPLLPEQAILNPRQLRFITDWLRGEFFEHELAAE